MLVALVFVLARNIVKLVVERRRGAAVRAVPREAGGAAARHDARAGGARADRRQRADSHEHRSLVQRADGRDSLVGESDRRATTTSERQMLVDRSRGPHRAGAGRGRSHRPPTSRPIRDLLAPDVTLQRVQMVEVYRVGRRRADRCRRWSRSSTWRRRSCRPGTAAPPADRLAAQALGGSSETRSIEALGTSGDLLHAAAVIRSQRRARDGRRRRDRLSDRRARGAVAPHDAGVRELQPAARAEAAADRRCTCRSS